MPLLDHFHPPLYPHRSWESFHSRWANSMADSLNRLLPPRYFSEVQIHLGSRVEADVAEFESGAAKEEMLANGGIAFPDDIEVHVRDEQEDARLVAVVELVSPRNKDRPESRRAFAAKCAAYLQRGIGLMTVDIVTHRQSNLFNELIRLMGWDASFLASEETFLHAVAFGPMRRNETDQIDVWSEALSIGGVLPVLPLPIRGHRAVPLDLEATYTEARERGRL